MKFNLLCTQVDGSLFRMPFVAYNLKDARQVLRDYREVFTKCTGWRLERV